MIRGCLTIVLLAPLVTSGCTKSPAAVPMNPVPADLPIYPGVQLGPDSPSGAVLPASMPTVGSATEYHISRGDVLEITVLEAEELSRVVRVSDRGEISLPLLGVLTVGGLTTRGLEELLVERLRERYMLDPQVAVEVQEIRSDPIYVVGEVNRPGGFPLAGTQRITVLQAVALGQGLRPLAAKGDVVVIRTAPGGEQVKIPVDLRQVLAGRSADLALQPNDIVFVPTSRARSIAGGVLSAVLRVFTFRAIF